LLPETVFLATIRSGSSKKHRFREDSLGKQRINGVSTCFLPRMNLETTFLACRNKKYKERRMKRNSGLIGWIVLIVGLLCSVRGGAVDVGSAAALRDA